MIELYSSKEIVNIEVKPENIRHDVMSYGLNNIAGKFLTNYNTIKYLALNENKNKVYRTCERRDKAGKLINCYQYTQPVCLVENKTQYYVLNFDFDFDYKYDKYPEIYQGFTTQHEKITDYIV